ncbi:hypothetical protein LX64_01024 [Chitinophaga skermanii]|uniref:Uncharacterized protein n=1 Tax=Chitinophaga skermanii TaxID=331697 RepID=A0A327QXC8_9BACT|nr:hypothetical protein [Chitinophaga skermanii]RAJ08374.1 hypothetical protein LX64_01024 [Chitinophaga skermanii]
MTELFVIPECYVDTNLIQTLVPATTRYNHQKGCGSVTKVMKERFKDDFAIGIIDKDKQEVDYLKEFTIVIDTSYLSLHRHRDVKKHHYIIQIKPAVERFILRAVENVGINIMEYGLSMDLDELKKITKSTQSHNDYRFTSLFTAIIDRNEHSFVHLRAVIMYLKNKRFQVTIEELQQLV